MSDNEQEPVAQEAAQEAQPFQTRQATSKSGDAPFRGQSLTQRGDAPRSPFLGAQSEAERGDVGEEVQAALSASSTVTQVAASPV